MKYVIQHRYMELDNGEYGPHWRYYTLYAEGDSLAELIESAEIHELDQDGGFDTSYGLEDATEQVARAALDTIERAIQEVLAVA
jgi:hypothetical protein